MEYSKAESYVGPLASSWLILAFLVVAVLVARSRPAWLPGVWLGS